MSSSPTFIVLGAGVIGLTTALSLRKTYPNASITIIAQHFPGDRSIDYCSPWAGANWCSMATDNGPLEHYDAITYRKFGELAEGTPEAGIERMDLRVVLDADKEEAGMLSDGTGKVWYEGLVPGGLRELQGEELRGGVCGFEFGTFRINTQVYLGWLQNQCLVNKINILRQRHPSLTSLLTSFTNTTVLLNCTGIGSLHLTDVRDTQLYPTRGQTVLVAEPTPAIQRMYLRSPARIHRDTTYIFPRPLGGGVILGGSRQDDNWSGEVDMQLAKEIMEKCCQLCPELGKPEDLKIMGHGVGLRPSRKGGPRIELEKWSNGVAVVHNYGHAGAGYQSSWGTAERAVELVKKALSEKARL